MAKKGKQYLIIFFYQSGRFKQTLALNTGKEEVNREFHILQVVIKCRVVSLQCILIITN